MSNAKVVHRPGHSWPLAMISLGVLASFGSAMIFVWLLVRLVIA